VSRLRAQLRAAGALAIVCAIALGAAAPPACARDDAPLVALAAAKFPNLTRAERALLQNADVNNVARSEFAVAGTSADPADPSNDPAHASEWDAERAIRASLIRWLCVDPDAVRMVDPRGLRILGARITGPLDLSYVQLRFPIVFRNCAISERIDLTALTIPALDLDGSYTGEIEAPNISVRDDLSMGHGFHAGGEVWLWGSRIGGSLDAWGGHFRHSKIERHPAGAALPNLALAAENSHVEGDVVLCCGFESDGGTSLARARIGGSLECFGAHFINPNNYALAAPDSRIEGVVHLVGIPQFHLGPVVVNGLVQLVNSTSTGLAAGGIQFLGAQTELHGLIASAATFKNWVVWTGNTLSDGTTLDLGNVTTAAFYDDEKSWPQPGHLLIDGLTYASFGGGAQQLFGPPPPRDAATRLRWLALQPGFHPQPYRQLAKVLAESGDDAGALQVRIAAEDLRYAQFGALWRAWGALLKYTIGYGHRPLLTVLWALAIIVFGWALVRTAARANLMRQTYPENTPTGVERHYESLNPLLYSIDVFFPFVNLHQEYYWWPDSEAAGEWRILGRSVRFGSLIRYYLWFQIGAGWLLSAIFVAGVTGLIRGD
jgi:hypothetical protein